METYCWLARRRLLAHCAGLCVQALGGDLNAAWRLSFSDESALEVSVRHKTRYTNRRLTLPLQFICSVTDQSSLDIVNLLLHVFEYIV